MLLFAPDPALSRLKAAFGAAHVPVVAPPPWGPFDGGGALSTLAPQHVDCAVLLQQPDGGEAELCRLFKSLAVPTVLLTTAAGPLQVNAVRKSSGATLALGAAATDADVLAAFRTLTSEAQPPVMERAPVQLPYPVPAAENDPAWIFARYCLRNSTGTVKLAAKPGNAECTIFLEGGRPSSATSNAGGLRIGEILVRKRLVRPEYVERAAKVAEQKKVRIGSVLVTQGVIAADVMAREAAEQYVTRIVAAFAWPAVACTVRFEAIPREDAVIPRTREALLVDGLRHHYDLPRLENLLPGTAVFAFAPDAGKRLGSFAFTPKEAAVLGLLDGSRTIAEVAEKSGSPLDARRALYAGVAFDLLRPPG